MSQSPSITRENEVASVPADQGVHAAYAVTIDRPVEELYNFWHDPTNFPQIFTYVTSVEMAGQNRAHWTIKLPTGQQAESDVEVYTDTPNEVISWRSLPESQMRHAGSVRFRQAPGNRGTEVSLDVEFVPPGGKIGELVLKLFGEAPRQYIGQYLREFKMLMETGEKATTEGQTSGRDWEVEQ